MEKLIIRMKLSSWLYIKQLGEDRSWDSTRFSADSNEALLMSRETVDSVIKEMRTHFPKDLYEILDVTDIRGSILGSRYGF